MPTTEWASPTRRCQYCLSETEFKENMVIDYYYCPRHGFLFPSETVGVHPNFPGIPLEQRRAMN